MTEFIRAVLNEATCPVCGSQSDQLVDLAEPFLRQSLGQYFGETVSAAVEVGSYRLLRCRQCTLEFASPMQAGGSSFYHWITAKPSYYPNDRWEWGEVRNWLSKQSRPLRLLEVGCGSGAFLCSLKPIEHVNGVGLDTTAASVVACHAKGLEVYDTPLEQITIPSEQIPSAFDVIVAFHCLEHVPDPKGFIASMVKLLKPGGRIFLSTPYSPMSFEHIWFDPLNHPPHHLSRWNKASFEELAKQLDLSFSCLLAPASSFIDRVLESLNLSIYGPQNLQRYRKLVSKVVSHPLLAGKAIVSQLTRELVNGSTAGNVVLVEYGCELPDS
ncbi:class I SAM-dependent methyltransferase [Microcystis elabens FACHB-917]|nr:class I SAM-dependent methyltransferase [Microcystis elabens FACHB-917]